MLNVSPKKRKYVKTFIICCSYFHGSKQYEPCLQYNTENFVGFVLHRLMYIYLMEKKNPECSGSVSRALDWGSKGC